jgi:hypothetical protein
MTEQVLTTIETIAPKAQSGTQTATMGFAGVGGAAPQGSNLPSGAPAQGQGEKKPRRLGPSINLDEDLPAFKKPRVNPGAYVGTIVDAKEVYTPSFDDPSVKERKYAIGFELDAAPEPGKTTKPVINYYVTEKIAKGNKAKGFSMSKLYALLDMAGEIKANEQALRAASGQPDEILRQAIDQMVLKLRGRKFQVVVKDTKPGTPNAYSTVTDVLALVQ